MNKSFWETGQAKVIGWHMHWAKQHPGLCHAISIPSFKIQTCRRINCIPETMAQIYLGIETFSCGLLRLQMARMDIINYENTGPMFSSFACRNH